MKIKYYGTGDAYGIPEPFCSCPLCSYAREHGGKDIRTRSQATVDDIMLDCSQDLLPHTLFYGLDMRKYRRIFITHRHPDHYCGGEINSRYTDAGEWHFYYPQPLALAEAERREKAMRSNTKTPPQRFPEMHAVELFKPLQADGYTVTALPSNHMAGGEAVLYIVQHGGKNLFWMHDSGLLTPETAEYLRTLDFRFDAVSMDCTLARGSGFTPSHMDILQCAETARMLREAGRADDRTVFILSQMGHLIGRTHEELCREAEEFGFLVAYDTMEIEV